MTIDVRKTLPYAQHCINCLKKMNPAIDADPNGDMDCKCARCKAEENHDFDREPDVKFDRRGQRIKPSPEEVILADAIAKHGLAKLNDVDRETLLALIRYTTHVAYNAG